MDNNRKKVSVLIPCRNEAQNIEGCIKNVYDFEPSEGGFEVIIIDGMSDDGTRDILYRLKEEYNSLSIIDNSRRTVPHAMNLGIAQAQGEYIVRTDVRCIHPKTYLKDLIKLSEETGADNVGGVLIPIGETYTQKSIATAYKSPVAMGGALRDRGNFVGETDAVYGGCFRRERLLEIGMYDESMVRNQDDELSFRLRKSGGKVIQSGNIKVKYFPRKHFKQLFKQFLQYGYWKVTVLKKHPVQASWRHYAPAMLVSGFSGLLLATLFNVNLLPALLFYSGVYLLSVSVESLRLTYPNRNLDLWPGVLTAIVVIHTGFGLGFMTGVVSRFLSLKPRYFESLSR
jgi:glycosyltransferase involved in cell wall biosynthesis